MYLEVPDAVPDGDGGTVEIGKVNADGHPRVAVHAVLAVANRRMICNPGVRAQSRIAVDPGNSFIVGRIIGR